MVENILSIDVEEIFHGELTRRYGTQGTDFRTPYNVPLILQLLRRRGAKATFFVTGEIAWKFPETVRMIIEEGHEVAFHGWKHLPLWKSTPTAFRNEIRAFRKLHPNCKGYRAPSFSLDNKTKWALRILQEERFEYDSSIFPTWTPLYGLYGALTRPYRPSLRDLSKEDADGSLIEFPLMVYRILGIKLPIAGGFWLRFFNLSLIRRQIETANREHSLVVMYLHNWELDPEAPRLRFAFPGSFLTYHNIDKTGEKLESLLSNFNFTSFREYVRIKEIR